MRRVRRRGERREDGEFADEPIENSPTDCRSLATVRSRRRTARALLQLRRSRHAWSVVFGPAQPPRGLDAKAPHAKAPSAAMAKAGRPMSTLWVGRGGMGEEQLKQTTTTLASDAREVRKTWG